jgi:hypothetical protein
MHDVRDSLNAANFHCVERATEQTARRSMGEDRHGMDELLQQIDLDYYRSALLLVARADLERLRQECASDAAAAKPRKVSLDADHGTRASLVQDGA